MLIDVYIQKKDILKFLLFIKIFLPLTNPSSHTSQDDEIISWWKMRSLQDRNQVTEQIVFDDVSMDVEITILYVKNGVGKSDSKINLKS